MCITGRVCHSFSHQRSWPRARCCYCLWISCPSRWPRIAGTINIFLTCNARKWVFSAAYIIRNSYMFFHFKIFIFLANVRFFSCDTFFKPTCQFFAANVNEWYVTNKPHHNWCLLLQIYRIMTSSGYGDKDFSSIFKFLQQQEQQQ